MLSSRSPSFFTLFFQLFPTFFPIIVPLPFFPFIFSPSSLPSHLSSLLSSSLPILLHPCLPPLPLFLPFYLSSEPSSPFFPPSSPNVTPRHRTVRTRTVAHGNQHERCVAVSLQTCVWCVWAPSSPALPFASLTLCRTVPHVRFSLRVILCSDATVRFFQVRQLVWPHCVADSFATRAHYTRAQSMTSRTRCWMVARLLCLWMTVSSSVSPSFFPFFFYCIFPSRLAGCTGNSATCSSPGPRVNLALRRLPA